MPVFLWIGFAVLVFLGLLYYRFTTYMQNTYASVETARAKLTGKETHTSNRIDAEGAMASDDVYRLVYCLESGEELAFNVGKRVYQNVPEGEWGTLKFQGNRFIGFEFRADETADPR